MALKVYNAETLPVTRMQASEPTFAIDHKNGLFRINRCVCDLAGLKNNTQIEFAQDDEKPLNWFFRIVKEKGYPLKEKKSVSGGLVFSNLTLARTILASAKINDGRSTKIQVKPQPLKLHGCQYFALDFSKLTTKK